MSHLEGFTGILQVDGYAGYRKLARRNDVRLAFCWSHVRRGFYELATPGPSPTASEALQLIAELYAIEKDTSARRLLTAASVSGHRTVLVPVANRA